MSDDMLDEWLKGIREETQDKANQPTPTPLQLIPQQPRERLTPEELIIKRFFDALDWKPLLVLEKDTYPPTLRGKTT